MGGIGHFVGGWKLAVCGDDVSRSDWVCRFDGLQVTQKPSLKLLAYDPDQNMIGKLPLFGGLDAARFRRQVSPGDELVLIVELTRMSSRAGKGVGRALLNDEVACECELMFVLVDA